MEFKKDDVLICVDEGTGTYLTNGKEYVAIGLNVNGFVVVTDDNSCVNSFRTERFKLKEKTVEEIKWKVGLEVWDVRCGKGSVINVEFDLAYPVQVDFGTCCFSYTLDGKYESNNEYRSLYFSEPKIIAELHPKFVPTLIGKRLIVSNGILFTIEVHGETLTHVISEDGISYPKYACSFYEIGEAVKFD